MVAWPFADGALAKLEKILVPLSSSQSNQWAFAVVRMRSHFIDIYDSLPSMQLFMPLYPKLVAWANSMRARSDSGDDWKNSYRICEKMNVCHKQDFGVDAVIFMLGHAYNITTMGDDDCVYPKNLCKFRSEICSSIIAKKVGFLSTAPPNHRD